LQTQGAEESHTTPAKSTRGSQAGDDAKRILFVGGSADGQAKLERIVEKLGGVCRNRLDFPLLRERGL